MIQLDVETAKIFYLHFALDMTFEQISEEMEINESTVKTNLYRMLKKIRKNFSGGEKDEE